MKILMVCLGNICRSPLAHGILESKLDPSRFTVDSAGTANYHIGEPPDERSIKVASENKIDISQQRGRQFVISDFDKFDQIYAMDRANFKDLKQMARNEKDLSKLSLFMDSHPDSPFQEVPDPYYGDMSDFELAFDLIESTCERIARNLYSFIENRK
jgi:protein-tyrosine phosphatase